MAASVIRKKNKRRRVTVRFLFGGEKILERDLIVPAFHEAFIALVLFLFALILFSLVSGDTTYSDQTEVTQENLPEDLAMYRDDVLSVSELMEQIVERQSEISRALFAESEFISAESAMSSMIEAGRSGSGRFLPALYLKRRLRLAEAALGTNDEFSSMYFQSLRLVPHRWPLRVSRISINSGFGNRSSPWYTFTTVSEFHSGVDLGAKTGDSVLAAASGRIIRAERDSGGYGNVIRIRHPSGYETLYAHLSSINVRLNQEVKPGELIGHAGATGSATGPHLHYEVIDRSGYRDPMHFLAP